jgi:predicted phosphodiesterase
VNQEFALTCNHDQSYLEKSAQDGESRIRAYLQNLPQTLNLEIEGKRIYVVHANPPSEQHGGIKLLDQQGELRQDRINEWTMALTGFEHDVLIVGHTHQVYAVQLGDVFVINPGSSAFNHSCMILSLPDLSVQTCALGKQEIIKCWNFSMLSS